MRGFEALDVRPKSINFPISSTLGNVTQSKSTLHTNWTAAFADTKNSDPQSRLLENFWSIYSNCRPHQILPDLRLLTAESRQTPDPNPED